MQQSAVKESSADEEAVDETSFDHRKVKIDFDALKKVNEDIVGWILFDNAALYVLPSDIEGMPISLLEAMRCGLPCLVSDIPENTQLLGGFGASFAKGDVAALRAGLEKALESPPPAGEAQAETIRAHYDWDEVARATLALYHKAAERS